MHPHPPYQLWNPESFNQAIQLIYDDSRALTVGGKPDFEFYRARLNDSLRAGSITVGQDDYWQRIEADKYNRACHNNWRIKHHYEVSHHKPYGNPGPGIVARVQNFSRKGCTYKWQRDRRNYRGWKTDPINCAITIPTTALFNIDAYTAGDFKQFFNDPRTRADYLQWSYFLLTAEEYLAGNREIGGESRKAKRR